MRSIKLKIASGWAGDKYELYYLLLTKNSASSIQTIDRCVYFPDAKKPFIWLKESKKGRIEGAFSSAENAKDAQTQLDEVLHLLKQSQAKIEATYVFSSFRIAGSLAYGNVFHLRSCSDDSYREIDLVSGVNSPHVFEFSYLGSDDHGLNDLRRDKMLDRLLLGVNALLTSPINLLGRSFEKKWVVFYENGFRKNVLAQVGYDGDKMDKYLSAFSSVSGQAEVKPPAEYYNRRGRATGSTLDVPDNFHFMFEKYINLSGDERVRFECCFRWLMLSPQIWRTSRSLAFCALVNAIECLNYAGKIQPKPGDIRFHVESIFKIFRKQNVDGPTKNFENILRKWIPEESAVKVAKDAYGLRSKVYHSGYFVHGDTASFPIMSVVDAYDHETFSGFQLTARIIAVNELMESQG